MALEAKIRACGKLQQVESRQRDRVGQQLDAMRQRHHYMAEKLLQLAQLGDERQMATTGGANGAGLNSAALMNHTRADHALQKVLNHCQHEQAVLEAQCHAVQRDLAQRQARLLGLESALERWQTQQKYQAAKREQLRLEELINARVRKRPWSTG